MGYNRRVHVLNELRPDDHPTVGLLCSALIEFRGISDPTPGFVGNVSNGYRVEILIDKTAESLMWTQPLTLLEYNEDLKSFRTDTHGWIKWNKDFYGIKQLPAAYASADKYKLACRY